MCGSTVVIYDHYFVVVATAASQQQDGQHKNWIVHSLGIDALKPQSIENNYNIIFFIIQ